MSAVQTFHRYRLIRRIARGGMAEVFLAAHRGAAGFERRVALKKILPVYSGMEEFSSLFRDEARVAAALDHSGIVQVYDFGEHAGEYYIAMEYVDGPDLEEVLDRCRRRGILPPVEVVLHIGHRLAGCLEYAHSRATGEGQALEIVHRDVSPPNVLIGVAGEIKLTDFGVARSSVREAMTRPGVLRGKYAYMSPEQVSHEPMDQRSDLFSIGTVLYEALTGVNPFEGSTDYQTMESVSSADVEPAGFLRPDTPAELDRILVTCLEPDPQHRYQDAGSLRRDLAALMLDYPRSDDPQALVDFLQDVFPERAAADDRAALLDGSVPAWEMLAHRLSPMLVVVPDAPEDVEAAPIRLVDKTDEQMAADAIAEQQRAIFREVGPRARRRRNTDKTTGLSEEQFVTNPGADLPPTVRAKPRASFLPPVDDSLDRIPVDSLPVLGVPDPEPAPEPAISIPTPFVSLVEEGDPLLDDLIARPPTNDEGVPMVNEWDLDDDAWGARPPGPSDEDAGAADPLGIPSFGAVAEPGSPRAMGSDLFSSDAPHTPADVAEEPEEEEGDPTLDDEDASDSYVPTHPSLPPARVLSEFVPASAPPDAQSLLPEDQPTQRGDFDADELAAWDAVLADAGEAEPDGLHSDTGGLVEDVASLGVLDASPSPEEANVAPPPLVPPRDEEGTAESPRPPLPGPSELKTDDNPRPNVLPEDEPVAAIAGALTTGTVPGAAVPVRPAAPRPPALPALGIGLPTPGMMRARPRKPRAPAAPDGKPIPGYDTLGRDGSRPLAEMVARASAGGTVPSAPAWPIKPDEFREWQEKQQSGYVEREPEDWELQPPSSPALAAIRELAPPSAPPPQQIAPPRPAAPRRPPPVDSPQTNPTLGVESSLSSFRIDKTDPALAPISRPARPPSRPGDAPPLRIGRRPRQSAPSKPGTFVPIPPPASLPGAPVQAPSAPGRARPPEPPPPPEGGLIPWFQQNQQTLLMVALAVLVPLLFVLVAGQLDRDPTPAVPQEAVEEERAEPRYVEPLEPLGSP